MKARALTVGVILLLLITTVPPISPVSAHNGPHARFAHLAPTVDPIDIYIGTELYVKALKYKDATDFLEMESAQVDITIVPAGAGMDKSLTPQPFKVAFAEAEGVFFTIAIVGSLKDGTFDLVRLPGEKGTLPAEASATGTATAGKISISDAWARATAVGQATPDASMPGMSTPAAGSTGSVSAVYMTIQNSGDQVDKLISATSDEAGTVTFHETVMTNDMAQMNALKEIEIPAKGKVELKPGGMHIMLSDLKQELTTDDTVGLVLTFQSGTTIIMEVPVRAS